MASGRASQTRPDLLEPLLVVFRGNDAQYPGRYIGSAVAARFAFHQNEFNVVLDDRVRLIRLAEKARSVFDFVNGIGDLMPDDRSQIVKPDSATVLLNRGVKRYHRVSPEILPARETNVSYNTNQAPPRSQRAIAVSPNLIQLSQKLVVIINVTHLA